MARKPTTIADKLLVACLSLCPEGERAFTAEDLVVEAWRQFPDAFGLQGYAQEHPDSNRVLTNIMGNKGLAGSSYIERVGEKTYRLTPMGLAAASDLLPLDKEQAVRGTLARKRKGTLERMIATRAYAKYSADRKHQITQRDALNFLGVTVRADSRRLRARMDVIADVLGAAQTAVEDGGAGAIAVAHGGAAYDAADLARLSDCYDYLREAFADELSQMLSR